MAIICYLQYEHSTATSAFFADVLTHLGLHAGVVVVDVALGHVMPSHVDLALLKTHQESALTLARALERKHVPVVNPTHATIPTYDRFLMHDLMIKTGVFWPETSKLTNGLESVKLTSLPVIVKPRYSDRDFRMEVIRSASELIDARTRWFGEVLVQQFIEGGDREEIRVFVCGDYIFATKRLSKLQTRSTKSVREEAIPVLPAWRRYAKRISEVFGLGLFGFDIVENRVVDVSQMQSPLHNAFHVNIVTSYVEGCLRRSGEKLHECAG